MLACSAWIMVLAVAVAATLGMWPAESTRANPRPIKVMTRNLYLGADLTAILTAPTVDDLAIQATATFQRVEATNFPARARVLAGEIKDADPLLIGLQETSLWRRGDFGVIDGPTTPATIVVYDYLQLLLGELSALGDPYIALIVQEEGDNEVPTTLGFDIRLTDRDVILAKAALPPDELEVVNALSANYVTNLSVPTVAGPVTIKRGWTAIDAIVNRTGFRFVNMHLEAFTAFHRAAQAEELLSGSATKTPLPIIIVADLNSPPGELAPSAYTNLYQGGFIDTWFVANGAAAGLTCCNDEDLRNPTPAFDVRIDYVLTRPALTIVGSKIVGVDRDNRTPSGLWPSDHAGMLTTLQFSN
jgi:endonuclease/exonuclease/phosphatase family metal-dependent hydrolase